MTRTGPRRPRYIRHCILCLAVEVEAELVNRENHISGAVNVWCVDVAACRSRHEENRTATRRKKREQRRDEDPA